MLLMRVSFGTPPCWPAHGHNACLIVLGQDENVSDAARAGKLLPWLFVQNSEVIALLTMGFSDEF